MSHPSGVEHVGNDEPKVTEVRVGDWTIVTVLTGGPWRQRCYIVIDDLRRDAVVIDPGGSSERIAGEIRSRQVRVSDVLLTHAHHDHVGAVAAICREFGVKGLIAEADARLLRQAPTYAFRFGGKKIEMPAPVEYFQADDYRLAAHTIAIHRTPGHTAGSVVFQFSGFAMTGDTLLFQCVGRTDLPGGDVVALRASVDALLKALEPATVLFAGHGRSWTVAEARAWWAHGADAPTPLDTFEMIP